MAQTHDHTKLKFTVRHQWRLYLQRAGVQEGSLPEDQRREMMRAFYGAAGQFLLLMRDDVPKFPFDQAADILENLLGEVTGYWEGEVRGEQPPFTTSPADHLTLERLAEWRTVLGQFEAVPMLLVGCGVGNNEYRGRLIAVNSQGKNGAEAAQLLHDIADNLKDY